MSVFRRNLRILLVAGVAALAARSNADDQPIDWKSRGDEIVRLVREHFFNRTAAEKWATNHTGYAAAIDNALTFSRQTKQILAELKASHTGYYTTHEPEFFGLSAIFAAAQGKPPNEYDSIGADITTDHFVRARSAVDYE